MKSFKFLLVLPMIFIFQILSAQEWAVIPRIDEGWIVIVDVETNEVIDEIETFGIPLDIAWTNDCMKLYVSYNSDPVGIFEFNGVSYDSTGTMDRRSLGIMVSPNNELWVTNKDSTVRIHSTIDEEVLDSVNIGVNGWSMHLTSDGSKAIIASHQDEVVFIDTADLSYVSVPADHMQWACLSTNGDKYVAMDEAAESVYIYDVNSASFIESIDLGVGANGCAWSLDDSKLFVANSIDNNLSVINADINSDTYINSGNNIELTGETPIGMDITDDGAFLYVPMTTSGELIVIDVETETQVEAIDVGYGPVSIGLFIKPAILDVEINVLDQKSIEIYPIPSTGDIYFNSEVNWLVEYNILNLNGELVTKGADRINEIKLTLEPGTYLLNLIFEDNTSLCKKIVVLN